MANYLVCIIVCSQSGQSCWCTMTLAVKGPKIIPGCSTCSLQGNRPAAVTLVRRQVDQEIAQVFTMIWPLKEWILKLQVMITNTLLTTSSANASKRSPNVHNSSRNHPRPNAWKNRRCSFAKMLFGSSISGYKFLVNVRLDLSCWEPLTKAIPKSSTFKSCRTFSCIFSEVEGCWLLTVYLVAEGCWLVRESVAFKNLGVHGPRDERLLWFCELWILDTQLQLNMFRLQHIRKATKRNQVVNMICILFQSPKIYSPHTKMATRQQMVSRLDHFIKHSNGNRWNLTGTSPS